MHLGSNGVDHVRSLRKIWMRFSCTNLCINDPVPPDLHRTSCSNEMIGNALIHDFWVQWGVFCAFVAKNSDAKSLDEFVH
jgi:hypothetical protein